MTDSSETSTNDSTNTGQTRVGHCKQDDVDVYIGRGYDGESLGDVDIGERGWLGNPFPGEQYGRQGSIERFEVAFRAALEASPELRSAVADLAGKQLGCWCQRLDEDQPACHGEVIARYADRLGGSD